MHATETEILLEIDKTVVIPGNSVLIDVVTLLEGRHNRTMHHGG